MKRALKDENGTSRSIEEKVVVYWSKKFQARSERENKKLLDFLKKLEASPENFRITALQSKGIHRFLKKNCLNQKTGELINSADIKALLDFDKMAEYRESMGYYQIVTSKLTMEPLDVIDKYHGLTQIEDQFRVMKSDLETRPIFVRNPDHVDAHLLICMIALVALRLIQKRIVNLGLVKVDDDACWSTGFTGRRIQQALGKWKVDSLPGDFYRFMDVDDPDLKLMLDAFGIKIPAKLYRRAELKSIKTNVKIFI
ncbi:transposase [Lachnospiraceae bacterium ZAX-1]